MSKQLLLIAVLFNVVVHTGLASIIGVPKLLNISYHSSGKTNGSTGSSNSFFGGGKKNHQGGKLETSGGCTEEDDAECLQKNMDTMAGKSSLLQLQAGNNILMRGWGYGDDDDDDYYGTPKSKKSKQGGWRQNAKKLQKNAKQKVMKKVMKHDEDDDDSYDSYDNSANSSGKKGGIGTKVKRMGGKVKDKMANMKKKTSESLLNMKKRFTRRVYSLADLAKDLKETKGEDWRKTLKHHSALMFVQECIEFMKSKPSGTWKYMGKMRFTPEGWINEALMRKVSPKWKTQVAGHTADKLFKVFTKKNRGG